MAAFSFLAGFFWQERVEAGVSSVLAPPSVMYKTWDYDNIDYGKLYPQYGPMGGMIIVPWYQVNPGPGKFDWSEFDQQLDKASRMKTAPFPDGSQISKPILLEVFIWPAGEKVNQAGWPYYHEDFTPDWVYLQAGAHHQCINSRGEVCSGGESGNTVGYVHTFCRGGKPVEGASKKAVMPALDDSVWQQAYFDMIRALAEKYDNDSRVAGVLVELGLDGESNLMKSGTSCSPPHNDYPVSGNAYKEFIDKVAETAREAFKNKPVTLTMGGQDFSHAVFQAATKRKPYLGVKSNALGGDEMMNQYWYKNGLSESNLDPVWPIAIFRKHSGEISFAFEDAKFTSHPASWYFGLLKVIAGHGDWVDWRDLGYWEGVYRLAPYFWTEFVPRYLGKKLSQVDSVWVALRETKYGPGGPMGPMCGQAKDCCFTNYKGERTCMYGYLGDYQYWLYHLEGKPGGKTVPLWNFPKREDDKEIFDRYTRRTDEASGNRYMYFKVDGNFLPKKNGRIGYQVKVIFKNEGNDKIGIEYKTKSGQLKTVSFQKGPSLGASGRFVEKIFNLTDAYFGEAVEGADFRLTSMGDGDENVHMVILGASNAILPRIGSGEAVQPVLPTGPCGCEGEARKSRAKGDYNCDGRANIVDFSLWFDAYIRGGSANEDLNCQGGPGVDDFTTWLNFKN